MRLLRVVLAIALAAATAGVASAQDTGGTLAGQVTARKAPLAGVQVQVFRAGETAVVAKATTGADGKYRISPLPQRVYRVEFSRDGYDPVVRTGIVVLSTLIESLDVVMVPIDTAGDVGVRIETPLGFIDLAIDTTHAPVTAANFLKYVDAGLYDGGRFNRVTRPDNYTPAPPDRPAFEIVQADINPQRNAERFPPIPLERTTTTGLTNKAGALSMPRGSEVDSARSGFVICLEDTPSLDFGSMRYPDGQGFAVFGRVVDGMDVVKKIQASSTGTSGAYGTETLTPPIKVLKAYRK